MINNLKKAKVHNISNGQFQSLSLLGKNTNTLAFFTLFDQSLQ